MKTNKSYILFKMSLLALALIVSDISVAHAASTTGATKATASVTSTCQVSATNINFGTINIATGSTYANGTLSILCTKKTSYSILMNYGTWDTKGFYTNSRADTGLMKGAASGDSIAYGLHPDTNYNAASWNAVPFTGTATGITQSITVYGVAVLGYTGYPTYPTPDTYSDNVTANITY